MTMAMIGDAPETAVNVQSDASAAPPVVDLLVRVTGDVARALPDISDRYWWVDVFGVYAAVVRMTLTVSVIQLICASKNRCLAESNRVFAISNPHDQ